MNNKKIDRQLLELIDVLYRFSKKDLKEFRNYLRMQTDDFYQTKMNESSSYNFRKSKFLSVADKNKIDIIGGLPFLLNSPEFFKSNEDIKDFSEKFLEIHIPKGNKSRAELIGIIVVGIAELPSFKIKKIKNALNNVLDLVNTGKTDDIFFEWERAIKSIR